MSSSSPAFFTRAWKNLAVAGATAALALLVARPCRAQSSVQFGAQTPGPTPFIVLLSMTVDNPFGFDYVTFSVLPKSGSVTRPVSARYSADYLRRRGYIDAGTGAITVPVFGLYDGYQNTVSVTTGFINGYTEQDQLTVPTERYKGNLLKHPEYVQARLADTSLSYDFIELKSAGDGDSPIVLDTDGAIRWVGVTGASSFPAIFYNNGFHIAIDTSVIRMDLDGSVTLTGDYAPNLVTDFHHNFDFGRDGIIIDVDSVAYTECVNLEIDPVTGVVLHVWNLANIITAAMTAGGDDPTQFVKGKPDDWFHNNATAYRASDNTLIVSSRENFVIALDYDSGAIKWILGDASKAWYQFPSLRKYALALGPNTVAPIGQHAVSIVRDQLLLFDNGFPSMNQKFPGIGRPYSAPRKYRIDTVANTATEVWSYKARKTVSSPVCSSVYEDSENNYLIDYATEGPFVNVELFGLNAAGARVFDFKFPETNVCGTGWNAVPIHLESLVFD